MARLPGREELLSRLVGFDTTSSRPTTEVADFICNLAERPGVEIHRDATADGRKENLVLRLGPPVDPAERAGLVLSGHLDVVPAEEPGWASDPFALDDSGNRWLGRGTADMKGFLALALDLFAGLAPAKLEAPLVLLFTRDEELGCLGSRDFVAGAGADLPLPKRAVIGEPTSLEVVRLHKGHLRLSLSLRGKSAHSGYPHRGINAIEAAGRAVTALAQLRQELERERSQSSRFFGNVPFVALNQATIRGGTAINVIPASCSLEIGLRPLPGERPDDLSQTLTRRVEETLERALPADSWTLEVVNDSPPLATAPDAPIHRELCALVGQTETRAVSFSSDAGNLSRLGMDCVLFGPGSIEVAHRANEFLPKAEFYRAAELLDGLTRRCCGVRP